MNYHNRVAVLVVTISTFLILGMGMFRLRLESDPENLWVSHSSDGYKQEQDFNNQFGAFFRTEQIILAQEEASAANIFVHDHLHSLYFLLSLINKQSTTFENR